MHARQPADSALSRSFYRFKLAVSGHIPNKDNLPYSLFGERLVTRLAERDRERFRTRRLLFTISPGRAGSEYLARLLDTASNIRAFHEPLPRMNGAYLQMAVNRPPAETFTRRRIKLLGINRVLARLASNTVYAETSHMFIKSFHDVVLDYYDNVQVINLRRPMHKVLKSFIELGFFSSANPISARWLHDPGTPQSIVEPLAPLQEMDQYDRCIAYLIDIEARIQAFGNRYPQVIMHDVMLEDITREAGARRLFRKLGAVWTEQTDRHYASVVNPRTSYKSALGESVTEAYCAERVRHYLREAAAAGIELPDIGPD